MWHAQLDCMLAGGAGIFKPRAEDPAPNQRRDERRANAARGRSSAASGRPAAQSTIGAGAIGERGGLEQMVGNNIRDADIDDPPPSAKTENVPSTGNVETSAHGTFELKKNRKLTENTKRAKHGESGNV